MLAVTMCAFTAVDIEFAATVSGRNAKPLAARATPYPPIVRHSAVTLTSAARRVRLDIR